MRRIINVILALSFFLIAVFAWNQLIREYRERHESADSYSDLEEFISFPEIPPPKDTDETVSTEFEETKPVPARPVVDFTELTSINGDCVAWIYIEDIAINYACKVYGHHNYPVEWNHYGCHIGGFLSWLSPNHLTLRHSVAIIYMLSFFVLRKRITVYQICTVSFARYGRMAPFLFSSAFFQ